MSSESSSCQVLITNYQAFWLHYLSQHQNPTNRILHVLGSCGGLACLVLAASISWKWFLLALPLGYGMAWLGHFLFERNQPTTFTYPLWSFLADWQLVFMLLTRQIQTPQAGATPVNESTAGIRERL